LSTNNISLRLDNYSPSSSSTCVFAVGDISEGDVIEQFITISTSWRSFDLDYRCKSLRENAIVGTCTCEYCLKYGVPFLIPTGNVAVYGHSVDPNSRIVIPQFKEGESSIATVVANRSIPDGDGIYIDRRDYFMSSPKAAPDAEDPDDYEDAAEFAD
jgi:hypothetical protein